MDYRKVYDALIIKAQLRTQLSTYIEVHHIQPKALGGTDDPSNLVKLTAKEHFIAHLLLAKLYGDTMWVAVLRMKSNSKNSRMYAIAKQKWSQTMSIKMLGNTHSKGKKLSEATKAKMRKPKPLVRAALLGKQHTALRKQNTSEALKRWWANKKDQQLKALAYGN